MATWSTVPDDTIEPSRECLHMKQNEWKRMMFKERKVYAEVDEKGDLVTQKGMVTIKYQPDHEMTYRARASAVTEIDPNLLTKKSKKGGYKKITEGREAPEMPSELLDCDHIIIFTDGACGGNPGPAGIGILLQYRSHSREISRFIGQGTNNIAELTAIKVALHEIKDSRLPVILYTDSAYAQGVLAGFWKAKKNQDLVTEVKKEMARFSSLRILKVEGHKGVEGNEIANRLASQAVRGKENTSRGETEAVNPG
jgi:ribonuclease HI